MSFLFGGGSKPTPRPPPPNPNIGDAAGEAAARAEGQRLKKRRGADDTILSGTGLGDTGGRSGQPRSTLG